MPTKIFLMAILLISIGFGHILYQVLLRRLAKWKQHIDNKSPGMGFDNNLKTYIRFQKRGKALLSDTLLWMLAGTVIVNIVMVLLFLFS